MASAGTTGTGAQSGPIANGQVTLFQFYVGPGQTVQVRNDNNSGFGASSATTGYIQGTEFINS
ncbi:MAG: hypothetical protein EBU84_21375 [Actinobacteria bacterium]|nr:hypothetical protein [Actinomycetota bacterium]